MEGPSIRFEGELRREDVVGHRLIAILQSGIIEMEYSNQVTTFYRLDSGVAFALPLTGAGGLCAEIPPPECQERNFEELGSILGQRIAAILRLGPESDMDDEAPYLLLENGYVVTDVMGASPGTGGEGLFIFASGEVNLSKMTDFFGDC